MVYLFLPLGSNLLALNEGYCTVENLKTCKPPKTDTEILNEKVFTFLYILLGLAGINFVFGTLRHVSTEKMAN
jgi:hypothetical protein